jgi:hypothetical protein
MRIVYLGPVGEDVTSTVAFGVSWVRGEPREVTSDLAARIGRHPHFRLEDDEAAGEGVATPPPASRRRRKVTADGGA